MSPLGLTQFAPSLAFTASFLAGKLTQCLRSWSDPWFPSSGKFLSLPEGVFTVFTNSLHRGRIPEYAPSWSSPIECRNRLKAFVAVTDNDWFGFLRSHPEL